MIGRPHDRVPTRPGDLPVLPPEQVSDAQRHRVEAAEAALTAAMPLPALPPAEAAALAQRASRSAGAAFVPDVKMAGDVWRVTYRRGGSLELGGDEWTAHDVLHAVAHYLVDPVFPAHGTEFCMALLDLTDAHLGAERRERLAGEFDAHKVRRTTASRTVEARRRAVTASAHECGVLARLVLADPDEQLICQLLEVGGARYAFPGQEDVIPERRRKWTSDAEGLVVRDEGGTREIAMERFRYGAYRFASSGGSRP